MARLPPRRSSTKERAQAVGDDRLFARLKAMGADLHAAAVDIDVDGWLARPQRGLDGLRVPRSVDRGICTSGAGQRSQSDSIQNRAPMQPSSPATSASAWARLARCSAAWSVAMKSSRASRGRPSPSFSPSCRARSRHSDCHSPGPPRSDRPGQRDRTRPPPDRFPAAMLRACHPQRPSRTRLPMTRRRMPVLPWPINTTVPPVHLASESVVSSTSGVSRNLWAMSG
jgi:hypothetical protein